MDHVGVSVKDIEKAVKFYEEVVNSEVRLVGRVEYLEYLLMRSKIIDEFDKVLM